MNPETIEEKVLRRFVQNRWTLCLAESCTGGQLAAKLTRIPGASGFFLGSLVVYHNRLKTQILGVPEALISAHGAVSREVVESMLQGVLKLTGSDFAIAVSGIAGPEGGTVQKPVGTIWGGIGGRESQARIMSFQMKGGRESIIGETVDVLLNELLRYTHSSCE